MRTALLAILTISLAPLAAETMTSPLPLVAVLPVSGTALDSSANSGVSASLATELARTGKFRLLEREGIGQLLKEQGLASSGAVDEQESCRRIGKLLAVDQLVLSSVSLVGNTWSLSARLVDATSGEVLRSATRNSDGAVDGLLAEGTAHVSRDLAGMKNGSRPWLWVAGGVALAAGTTAALLFSSDAETVGAPPAPASGPVNVKVQIP